MMAAVAGLSASELARVRGRLEAFAEEMFEPMARKDQRRWGAVYLRGLMLEGKRKSMEAMAAGLQDGDDEGLQQVVNQSPWSAALVRERLARRMSVEIAPEARRRPIGRRQIVVTGELAAQSPERLVGQRESLRVHQFEMLFGELGRLPQLLTRLSAANDHSKTLVPHVVALAVGDDLSATYHLA